MENDPILLKVRYWVKIVSGKSQGDVKTVYYNTDIPVPVFMKWHWYYKYRAALERIKNPKFHIELTHGHYPYIPPVDVVAKVLRDKIRNRKGKLTEYATKIRMARQTWTELFPIEDDETYKKCIAKIARIEKEKSDLETELNSILSP